MQDGRWIDDKGRMNAFHDLASMANHIQGSEKTYADMAPRVFVEMFDGKRGHGQQ